MRQGASLPYSSTPINKYARDDVNRESPLWQYHGNNYCRRESLQGGAKVSRQNYDEKWDLRETSKYPHTGCLLTAKMKVAALEWRDLAHTTRNEKPKPTTQVISHVYIIDLSSDDLTRPKRHFSDIFSKYTQSPSDPVKTSARLRLRDYLQNKW